MADVGITVRGLQAAVALVTAAHSRLEVSQEEVLGDTPAEEALRALTGLAAAFLRLGDPGVPGQALRAAGGLVARFETEGTVE
ncbi:hypothetical protein [Streptomyces mirabilis]|uniref:hypothetical protein n=1 Tax=Streptomyces mirabilis TaxID=68239 RepID=UPI0036DA44A7